MSYFGFHEDGWGGALSESAENVIIGTRFTMADTYGHPSNIKVRILGTETAKNGMCAIYTNGNPPTYVASSNQISVGVAGHQTVTFPFTLTPTLTADTDYFLLLWMESALGFGNIGTQADVAYGVSSQSRNYGDGWPSTLDNWGTRTIEKKSKIYCNYTFTQPPPPQGMRFTGTGTLTSSGDGNITIMER